MTTRFLRATAAVLPLLVAACVNAGPVEAGMEEGRLRVFNAVVNQGSTRPGDTLDVMVDGSTGAPGARALRLGTGTEYRPVAAGVHDFQARLSSDARPAAQSDLIPHQARVRTFAEWDHTVFLVGRVPAFGAPDVQPVLVREDPFPPSLGADGTRNARVRLVNAAPFASGSTGTGAPLSLLMSDATLPAPPLGSLAPAGQALYRNASVEVELRPGSYRASVVRGTAALLVQDTVQLAPGSVRTLVVVSTAAAATPSAANHRLVKLRDREFQ
jgi:hypothetical protein